MDKLKEEWINRKISEIKKCGINETCGTDYCLSCDEDF